MDLDTCASDHITFNLHAFSSYQTIIHVFVYFLNGSRIDAFISGNIILSPTLKPYSVLYIIPTFHVNLIFVTKLTSSSDYHLNFSFNMCHILQNLFWQMIVTDSLQHGLYVIDTNNSFSQCNFVVSNSFETWHLRLGHASDSSIHTLAKDFPLIPCNNITMKPCDSYSYSILFPLIPCNNTYIPCNNITMQNRRNYLFPIVLLILILLLRFYMLAYGAIFPLNPF